MINKLIILLVFVLGVSGCAVGPLVSHETARTVGDGNHELVAGYGMAGFVFKWNYGLTENWDIGLQWESLSMGVRSKYAFVNNKHGWSWAGAAGIGASVGGDHYYGDILGSYMTQSGWEPYGTLRIVHVKVDPVEFNSDDSSDFISFTTPAFNYEYGQFMLGTRYWFDPHWLLSLEVSSLFGISSGIEFSDNVIAGAAFGYRF